MKPIAKILSVLVAASLLVPACGPPTPSQEGEARLTAPVGDVSGCDQFGFAKAISFTDWTKDCGVPGTPGPYPGDPPVGPVLQMSVFFNCRTKDSETWYQRDDWYQCLNGITHPSNGEAQISWSYPDCALVDGVCKFGFLPDNPFEVDGSTPDGALLRALINNLNDARATINLSGLNVAERMQLLDAATLFADLADEEFVKKQRALAMHHVATAWRVVDMAVNFLPGAALVRDSIIILTGVNPITGETVTDTERAMIAGALLVPTFLEGAAHVFVDVVDSFESVARSGKAEAQLAEDFLGAVGRADQEVSDLVHIPCVSSAVHLGDATPLAKGPCGTLGELTAAAAEQAEGVLAKLRKGETSFGSAVSDDYQRTFFDSYGWELKNEVGQVHHAVEQGILDRYPGVVTAEEINSLENLRGIPIGPDGIELHQSEIRRAWNEFYRTYDVTYKRAPNKSELLSFAAVLDDLFGKDFVPKIR